jgi:hypothetical protein
MPHPKWLPTINLISWSGRPGSNRRHPAWEAGVLPLNYSRPVVDKIVDPSAPLRVAIRISPVGSRFAHAHKTAQAGVLPLNYSRPVEATSSF